MIGRTLSLPDAQEDHDETEKCGDEDRTEERPASVGTELGRKEPRRTQNVTVEIEISCQRQCRQRCSFLLVNCVAMAKDFFSMQREYMRFHINHDARFLLRSSQRVSPRPRDHAKIRSVSNRSRATIYIVHTSPRRPYAHSLGVLYLLLCAVASRCRLVH